MVSLRCSGLRAAVFALVFALCACGMSTAQRFQQNREFCAHGSFVSCEWARAGSTATVRAEIDALEIAARRRRCDASAVEHCLYLARLSFAPLEGVTVAQQGLWRANGGQDPARAVSILERVCHRGQRLSAEVEQSCLMLAAAVYEGRGTNADHQRAIALARRFSNRRYEALPHLSALLPGHPDLMREAPPPDFNATFGVARRAIEAGRFDDAITPFAQGLLQVELAREERLDVSEAVREGVALAERLWPHMVEREIAVGRVVSGVAHARAIDQRLGHPSALAGRVDEAIRAALAALERANPTYPSGRVVEFHRRVASWIRSSTRIERIAPMLRFELPPPEFRPRWRFVASDPSCAWLADEANALSATRSGDITVRVQGACRRTDRLWTTTENYTERVETVAAVPPTTQTRHVYRRAYGEACRRGSMDSCGGWVDETVTINPGSPAQYRDVARVRTIEQREIHVQVRVEATIGEGADAVNANSNTIIDSSSAQVGRAFVDRAWGLAAHNLIADLDRLVRQGVNALPASERAAARASHDATALTRAGETLLDAAARQMLDRAMTERLGAFAARYGMTADQAIAMMRGTPAGDWEYLPRGEE